MAVDAVARPQRTATIVRRLIDNRGPGDLRHRGLLPRWRAATALSRTTAAAAGRLLRRQQDHGAQPDGDPDRDLLKHTDTHRRSSELRRALSRVVRGSADPPPSAFDT